MVPDDTAPDDPLSPEEEAEARLLTPADLERIDRTLLSHASKEYRKVAYVIGRTMLGLREIRVPDRFYSQRVKLLVAAGLLESVGDLNRMRYSEVRLTGEVPITRDRIRVAAAFSQNSKSPCLSVSVPPWL